MSEDKCETIEILSPEAPGGFVVINKSDYDPAVHTIKGSEIEEKTTVKEKVEEEKKAGRPRNI